MNTSIIGIHKKLIAQGNILNISSFKSCLVIKLATSTGGNIVEKTPEDVKKNIRYIKSCFNLYIKIFPQIYEIQLILQLQLFVKN